MSTWQPNDNVDPVAAPPTQQYGSSLGYAVDIVFVIDITGSMTPVLDQVKSGTLGSTNDCWA